MPVAHIATQQLLPSLLCALCPGISYLLILDLFFNFFRYFVSKSWHEQCLWGGAAQVSCSSAAASLFTVCQPT